MRRCENMGDESGNCFREIGMKVSPRTKLVTDSTREFVFRLSIDDSIESGVAIKIKLLKLVEAKYPVLQKFPFFVKKI